MRNIWIFILIIVILLLGGLYIGGYLGPTSPPANQQSAPHAIDQTPSQ